MANATSFELEIVTPERILLKGEATEFVGPGWDGEFGVRPGHQSMVIALRAGLARYTPVGGSERKVVLGGGFAIVEEGTMVVLADVAEPSEAVDVEEARQARARAEKALEGLPLFDESWEEHDQARRLALARLEGAGAS